MAKKIPRSPYERLAGYVHLPRLIDKARLHHQGMLNGYNYKTIGFDKLLLDFLQVDPETFEAVVNQFDSDAAIEEWLAAHARKHTPAEIEAWNHSMIMRAPDTAEKMAHFKFALKEAGGDKSADVKTYFDLIELDEGRFQLETRES